MTESSKLNNVDDSPDHLAALHYAASAGHLHVVKTLLDLGADPNVQSGECFDSTDADELPEPGFTPLMLAAENGHAEVVRYLLDHGADPNIEDIHSGTALHRAAGDDNLVIVDLLVQRGAFLDAFSFEQHQNENLGWFLLGTPLHLAAYFNHSDTAKHLIEHGADIYAGRDGRTPLHYAAAEGCADVAKIILAAGHEANLREEYEIGGVSLNKTPLHYAARAGHMDVIQTLLEFGADPTLVEANSGCNCIEMAEQEGHVEVVQLLRKKLKK